ncbi:hypothetical protein ACU635_59075 [[Actinomadura] parvosata]|uniref:hypothetical protein n=1 Tax=[Actinomadura] parvosata TaxID=1955412 RepID=UPI00406C06E9
MAMEEDENDRQIVVVDYKRGGIKKTVAAVDLPTVEPVALVDIDSQPQASAFPTIIIDPPPSLSRGDL